MHLTPGTLFLSNWHLDALAFHLEQVRLGKIKRLMINIPPRYGKSFFASITFPAFLLGHDPTKRIIVVRSTRRNTLILRSKFFSLGTVSASNAPLF
jgi:hypothetical protein